MKTPAQYQHQISALNFEAASSREQLEDLHTQLRELIASLNRDLHALQSQYQGRVASIHIPTPHQQHSGKERSEEEQRALEGRQEKVAPYEDLKVKAEALMAQLDEKRAPAGKSCVKRTKFMNNFPGRGKVAVLKTSPGSVLEDIDRLMLLAEVQHALPTGVPTGLKINISWQTWYPACSTTPWQLEGTIRALRKLGYTDLIGFHNDTVVVDTRVGEFNNKHRFVTDKYSIPCIYLYEQQFEWMRVPAQAAFPGAGQGFPGWGFHPAGFGGQEHDPPAHGQNARVHHHHRRDEECLWRPAASQSPLDPQHDP